MAILAKECPLCGGKMMPPRCASYLTTVDDPGLPIMERHMKVLIYTCETCRYVAMFAPPSPLEEADSGGNASHAHCHHRPGGEVHI